MIGVVMATRLEADGLIGFLGLGASAGNPFEIFEGHGLVLIISGIGKTNAAMATTYMIERYRLTCVCNLGAAGATADGFPLGACLQVSRVMEPDRPDFWSGAPQTHDVATLEGFSSVCLATQDRPVVDSAERNKISSQAEIVDMEGAAVTQVCHKFSMPCYVFKFISDTAEHTHTGDIIDNILCHREAFGRFFLREVRPRLA